MQVKKINDIISVTATNFLPALRLQAIATHRHKAFVSRFSSRETVMSEVIFLG